jgi:CheY-like chemotaxis protein
MQKSENVDFDSGPVPILLVEDDLVEVEIIKDILRDANIQNPLYRVCDGAEALEVLHGHPGRKQLPQPCVILLDINMPKMDGLQLLNKIRADDLLKRNVIFILTTSARNEDKVVAYKHGIAGYVLKNNLNELAGMLRIYCEINEFPNAA